MKESFQLSSLPSDNDIREADISQADEEDERINGTSRVVTNSEGHNALGFFFDTSKQLKILTLETSELKMEIK